MELKETGQEGVDGIHLGQLAVHSLTIRGTRNYGRRTLLQGRRVFAMTVSASYHTLWTCVYCSWYIWYLQSDGFRKVALKSHLTLAGQSLICLFKTQ